MDAVFIYRDRSDDRFYNASTGEMHGGPDKMIVYLSGFLCGLVRHRRITLQLPAGRVAAPPPTHGPPGTATSRLEFQGRWPPHPYVGRLEVRQ
jgi:hypothetical protein